MVVPVGAADPHGVARLKRVGDAAPAALNCTQGAPVDRLPSDRDIAPDGCRGAQDQATAAEGFKLAAARIDLDGAERLSGRGRIEATRIISARTATLQERRSYEQQIR